MSGQRWSLAGLAALFVACGGDSSPVAPTDGPTRVSMTVTIVSADAAMSSRLRLSAGRVTQLDGLDELQLTVQRIVTAVGGSATVTSSCTGQLGSVPAVAIPQLDMPPQRVDESQPVVFLATARGGSVAFLGAIGSNTAELVCSLTGTDDQGMVVDGSAQVTVTPEDIQTVPVPGGTPTPPGFDKAFAPGPATAGGTTSLTFTIDNTANDAPVTALDFTDELPTGMTVAPQPNATHSCTGGMLTGAGDTGSIFYTGGTVGAGASCTVIVDVTSLDAGAYVNTTGDLTSSAGNSGSATDTLFVDPRPTGLEFTKEFTDDPVVADGTVTLEFTIENLDTTSSVSDIAFADDLFDVIPGLFALDLPAPDVCGPGSVLSGTDLLVLSDASLPPGGLCAIPVTLQLPGTAGTFTNTTTDLLVGGQPVAAPATDTLLVDPVPD